MTHKILPVILALMLAQSLSAQRNVFKLGIGYQRTRLLDEQASPLVYEANQPTFTAGYYNTGNKGKFTAELNGAIGSFNPAGMQNRYWYSTTYNPDGSTKLDSNLLMGKLYSGRIKLGWMQDISHGSGTKDKSQLSTRQFAGLSVNDQVFYSDNIVRTGWLNSATVNGDYQITSVMNTKHFISFKISIPLFGVNTRLPYHNTVASPDGEGHLKTLAKQGSRFVWFGNFQNIQLEAGYEYAFSKNFGLGIRYFGQWLQYSYEKPVRLYQNNIGLEASFK
jgi:hypothetical protein